MMDGWTDRWTDERTDRQMDVLLSILQAFTGDTLFIGSCGRPDLVGSIGFTSEQMARMMFHSLLDKICTLPDDVQVKLYA